MMLLFVLSGPQIWREVEGLGWVFVLAFLIYLVMRGVQAIEQDMHGGEEQHRHKR